MKARIEYVSYKKGRYIDVETIEDILKIIDSEQDHDGEVIISRNNGKHATHTDAEIIIRVHDGYLY